MVQHAKGTAEEVTNNTNINVVWADILTAFKADAIPLTCFRVEYQQVDHPPGFPNQDGGWKSYQIFIDAKATLSATSIHLRKEGRTLSLSDQDLRAQLSQTDYWMGGPIKKRIGPKGAKVTMSCWGIELDKAPMGRQDCTHEAYLDFRLHQGEADCSDPRWGELYAIVAAWEKAKEAGSV